jgi:hypothetical protein
MSIETWLAMEELTIEDVTRRLKAAEERFASRAAKAITTAI